MSETEMNVFSIIKNNNNVRVAEIAKAIGKSDKTVSRTIKRLKDLKYIERDGDDYNGYRKVIKYW